MKKDFVNIVILLDQSGSMASIKNDMEGALNTYLEDQKSIPGEVQVNLFAFPNNEYHDLVTQMCVKVRHYKQIFSENLKNCPKVIIRPSGGTPLFDAFSEVIDRVGADLAAMTEENRPAKTLFICITDGEENSSTFATKESVAQKIKHQKEVYNWDFVYLGANQDSFSVGGGFGVGSTSANFVATAKGISAMSAGLSNYTRSYRSNDNSPEFNAKSFDSTDSDS